jgi:hypothetical protein
MKPVLDERECPMQEQICKVIPACPEDAFLHSDDRWFAWEAGGSSIIRNGTEAAFASRNAAVPPVNLNKQKEK